MSDHSKPPQVFSRQPNDGDQGMRYEILRVPAKGLSGPIITSHDPIGLYTHWTGGRTIPCIQSKCEHCDANVSRRWYGYIIVYSQPRDRQFLFEYTASSANTIVEYFNQHRTLRGAKIEAIRHGNRPNGRLVLYLRPPVTEMERLPQAPNRVTLLSQMWSVPLDQFAQDKPPAAATTKQTRASKRETPTDLTS